MTLFRPVSLVPPFALLRRSEFRPEHYVQNAIRNERFLLEGLDILQLGFSSTDDLILSETMHKLGARKVARSEHAHELNLGQPDFLPYDGVVINFDRFVDIEKGVDRLMHLRRACPSCFVLIATAHVLSDDFGHHRRVICDSTLRLPLSASRLTEALEAALLNHRKKEVYTSA